MKKCGPGQSGAPENGTLSLRDDSVVFTVEGARTTVMSTKMSSIGEISVEQEEGSNVCRVSVSGFMPFNWRRRWASRPERLVWRFTVVSRLVYKSRNY